MACVAPPRPIDAAVVDDEHLGGHREAVHALAQRADRRGDVLFAERGTDD